MTRSAEEWRAAAIATVALVLLTTAAVAAVALVADLLSRSVAETEVFNRHVRTAFTLAGVAVMMGSLLAPWLAIRRSKHEWPAPIRRVAPFLGVASCLGALLGFALVGVGTNALLGAFYGPIPENSLLELPIAAVSLAAVVFGSLTGGKAAIVLGRRGVA